MESEPNEKEKLALKKYKLKEEDIEKLSKENILFISIETLVTREPKISEIFKKFQNKLVESDLNLFLHPKNYNYQTEGYKDLFKYEYSFPLKEKKQYAFIYDCLNFICYEKKDYSIAKKKEYYYKTLKDIFSMLNEKGIFIVLIDQYHFDYFFPSLMMALGDNYKTKLFINFYFIDFRPFLFLVSIQKMGESETPIITKDIKILITDFFSKTKLIGSSKISEMNTYLTEPLNLMRSYRLKCEMNYNRIKTLHPGQFYEMRIKSSPLDKNNSYTVTIYDSPVPEYQEKKKCVAAAVSYEITQEIVFYKQFSFNKMSNQLKASRLIVLEFTPLNPAHMQELAFELHDEIQLMKPEGYNEEIQISLWENNVHKQIVFEDEKFLIRDRDDKRRQLFFKNNLNILQGEIRTKLASKTNIANPGKGIVYYPLETLEKYKENRVVQCLDDNFLFGFYEESLLCTVFYIDLNKFPKNSIKIMNIGAGLGTLSFYFYKLYKGACEIYNIEKNKEIYEIGMKYFGYKNYDKDSKVLWLLEEGKNCIEKMAKFEEINANKSKKLSEKKYGNKLNYFDLICNEINEINPKESTIPSKEFFEDSYLNNVKSLLKTNGFYIVKLMGSNYKSFYECYLQLEKHFVSIFNIPTEGGLTSIFFCFKEKIENKEYQDRFIKNKEIIEKTNVIDFSFVKPFANSVLVKLEDMSDQRKKMEDNAKRL